MNSNLSVLMYHALTDDTSAPPGADFHYAVTRSKFRQHLELVRKMGFSASSVASILASKQNSSRDATAGQIAFTFDDGHESNAAAAADLLAISGSADLFINSSMVGQRNYLDWHALSDLAKAGISIQSHSHTHRYLDELSQNEIKIELAISKREIEDHVGVAVTLFAPPGGRMKKCVSGIAQGLGYHGICNSHVGVWKNGASPWNIPRFAVLSTTTGVQLTRWINQEKSELMKLKLRHGLLTSAKILLGNQGYEGLRSRLLGRGADGSNRGT